MAEITHQRPKLQSIYDALFSFESKNRKTPYPIHKSVSIDGKGLLDWLTPQLNITASTRILDAGCGTGNTLFQLYEKYRSAGVGLSISSKEIAFANQYAEANALQNQLQFFQRDFTHSMDDLSKFDLVVAIESLKHCEDPIGAIFKLHDLLNPGGQLVIVDDFIVDEGAKKDIQKHKEAWDAPGFITSKSLESHLLQDSIPFQKTDLTSYVPLKSKNHLKMLLTTLRLAEVFALGSQRMARNFKTYYGALLLEYLYLSNRAKYCSYLIERS
ncbi:MAG: class I SAM-dependent methyltransferase [Bacteroidota bacterium]